MRAVNLIPSDERRGASVGAGRSGGAAYIVLGMLALLAIFAGLYGLARHQVSDRKSKLASINAQTQQAEASASQLTPYTSFMSLREQRMQAVEQVVDSRFDWAHAFHELGRVLPRDASINSLDGAVGGEGSTAATPAASAATAAASSTAATTAAPSSATPPGSVPTMTLSGCAKTQSDVALTLQRLRLMDGVSAVSLQSSSKAATASTGAGAPSSEGHCTAGSPDFSVKITFDPLPTPSSTSGSSTQLTASTGAEK
jgi:Tfp pilus assembly protein PilN